EKDFSLFGFSVIHEINNLMGVPA
ncbi:IS6 family transposase, partial [Listeria monocytogenes]